MRKLYLRVYVAVVASLVAFALVAGTLWRQVGDGNPFGHGFQIAGVLAQNVLPPAEAPPATQQAALERLVWNLHADIALFRADGARLAGVGASLPGPDIERDHGGWRRRWGRPAAAVLRLPDGRWLVARVPYGHRPPAFPLFLTLGLVAMAVGAGAYPVVRRLTARLERLQAGVESLGAGELSVRVKVEGRDEVARLAESFNRAVARIESLVNAHRSLLATASHELRTPLTRIRLAIELMKPRADPARMRELEQDIAELETLIDEILLSSRLDAVDERPADEPVDLLALATEEGARDTDAEVTGQPVTVRGDAHLLRRMIRNLLENARRHGAPPVTVRVSEIGDRAALHVCDQGSGVPESEREEVFRPFHRVRGTERAGSGLGLTLVRQIARRHGGDARCLGRTPDGSCFEVTLPASPPAAASRPRAT